MINGNKIIIREKRLSDAKEDYAWETDPELAQLDAAPVLTLSYSQYLSDYAAELRFSLPTSHQFSVDTLTGEHIGNCSYYNTSINRSETELGIMIGNRNYWDKGYGYDVVTTLVNHIFTDTSLNRIHLKTLDNNARAQKCFTRCGFALYNHVARDGYHFALMQMFRHEWETRQKKD